MVQKIINIGNSAAVTIPKDFLRQTKIKVGEKVLVETDVDSKTIIIKIKKSKSRVPDLVAWTDEIINSYRPVLESLAKK